MGKAKLPQLFKVEIVFTPGHDKELRVVKVMQYLLKVAAAKKEEH